VADAGELVHGGAAAHDDPVADGDVAGQHDVVGQDDIVADMAVMRHVRIGQEHRIVADRGPTAIIGHAGMHGHAFTDGAGTADDQFGVFTLVVDVLRRAAEHRIGEDNGALANGGIAVDDDVAHQPDVVAEPGLGADDTERADLDIASKYRPLLDNSGGMDAGGMQGGRRGDNHSDSLSVGASIAPISASATLTPSTIASQWNRQMLPRCLILVT